VTFEWKSDFIQVNSLEPQFFTTASNQQLPQQKRKHRGLHKRKLMEKQQQLKSTSKYQQHHEHSQSPSSSPVELDVSPDIYDCFPGSNICGMLWLELDCRVRTTLRKLYNNEFLLELEHILIAYKFEQTITKSYLTFDVENIAQYRTQPCTAKQPLILKLQSSFQR
jgi:hypothetical protein